MDKENKKKDQNNKITSLEISDDVLCDLDLDLMLKESLMREADEIENELNHDIKLRGVGASDDMFEAIVEELRARELWEEERETEAAALEREYERKSEQERLEKEQLEQENRERIKRQKRAGWKKYSGIAAVVCLAVFGLGMTSEANRRLVFKAWDGLVYNFNYRFTTNYSEENIVRSKTKEETLALEEIKKEIGASVIDFEYLPAGMEYQGYDILEDNKEAYLFYTWGDKVFNVFMLYAPNKGVENSGYFVLGEGATVIDTVKNEQDMEIYILETDQSLEEQMYTAELLYGEFCYILNGMDSLEELKRIAKYSLIF